MKKAKKQALGMFGTGMALGAGSIGLSSMGGVPAANAATGLGRMSAALPAVGSIGGAGMVMRSAMGLRGIYKTRRGKRR